MPGRTAILTIAAAAFLSAPAAMAQQTPGDFRMLFTGDVMMSRLVRIEMEQRRTSPWISFSNLFHDVNFCRRQLRGRTGSGRRLQIALAACDSKHNLRDRR